MADYFGPTTDDAIRRYRQSENFVEKNMIFDKEIRPSFEKLIHSLIFVYRFQNLDDVETLKNECLAHLYENIHKFDPDRGTKGFSYFNVVARNWFINRSKDLKKREKNESELFCTLDHENVRHNPSIVVKSIEDKIVEKEFWVAFFADMKNWRSLVKKPQDKKVLDAVIFLFQNSGIISIYNRKATKIYIREITGLNSKQIESSLKNLKELYLEFKRNFEEEDGQEGDTLV